MSNRQGPSVRAALSGQTSSEDQRLPVLNLFPRCYMTNYEAIGKDSVMQVFIKGSFVRVDSESLPEAPRTDSIS